MSTFNRKLVVAVLAATALLIGIEGYNAARDARVASRALHSARTGAD
jgi:hypothetical protein